MPVPKARIGAIKALVSGSVLGGTLHEAIVNAEYDEVYLANRIRRADRKYLMQVLYSTRALDSCLRAFTDHHGIRGNSDTLGAILFRIHDHNRLAGVPIAKLPAARRTYFQNNIVNHRNRYMHQAGQAPANDGEVRTLIGEMDTCLNEVFAL